MSADSGFGANGDGLLAKKSGIFVNNQDYNKAALLCIPKMLKAVVSAICRTEEQTGENKWLL